MMSTESIGEQSPDQEVSALLSQAARLRVLADVFGPPSAAQNARVAEGLALQMVPGSDAECGARWAQLRRHWTDCPPEHRAAEHARLFHGQCPCPPHETAYGDGRRLGGTEAEMADISGFYAAFGLALAADHPDLPDHIATELEFYAALLIKHAYALNEGWREAQEITLGARRLFLADHLGRWPGAFLAALEQAQADSVYTDAAALVARIVEAECVRTGAQPRRVDGRAPAAPPGPMECPRGGCGGCSGGRGAPER